MNVAYLYYHSSSPTNPLEELMKYCLYYAKETCPVKFDVFNCLSIMENEKFTRELKFGIGDGILNYYLFNY